MEYNGGRTENDIVNWILKKVGPPSTEASCAGLKEKVEATKLVLAYFGEVDDKGYQTYIEVAQDGTVGEKYQFFHINDKECASSFGVSNFPGLVLFRKFDDSPLVYSGDWSKETIVEWL